MTPVTLALWQGAGVQRDVAATLAEVARIAEEAAGEGADLLVFPEGFLTGYFLPDLAPGDLRWVDAALAEVGGIARSAGLGLLMGTHLDTCVGLQNAAVVFDHTGTEVGRYAKRVLFGPWEKATFTPGQGGLLVGLCGLRVGVAICYDVEFPELIRAYARDGAELILVPTALMEPHGQIARVIPMARALENQLFLGYANRSGAEGPLTFTGLSCICGPGGEMLAQAGTAPRLLTARLNAVRLQDERAVSCYLDDLLQLGDLCPNGRAPG